MESYSESLTLYLTGLMLVYVLVVLIPRLVCISAERTYSEPLKWMRGKGRVTMQFGCCYNYAVVIFESLFLISILFCVF